MHYQQIRSEISNCVVNYDFEGLRNIHCNLILKKMEQDRFFSDFLHVEQDSRFEYHEMEISEYSPAWDTYHQKYNEYMEISSLLTLCSHYLH